MPVAKIVTGQKIGPGKFERAKELRREMTAAEALLWQRLKANRFHGCHFRRQQIVRGFIVDFYCHAAGLVIEVDGPIHASQVDMDRQRDQALAESGLQILRVSNAAVLDDIDSVLSQIYKFLLPYIPLTTQRPIPPAPFPERKGETIHPAHFPEGEGETIPPAHFPEGEGKTDHPAPFPEGKEGRGG